MIKNCNMHQYGQYCPVARAAEILADRWTLLIVRELLADVRHFNELERGLPHMSRTLLAERLRRLEQMRVLERRATSRGRPTEYRLTVWQDANSSRLSISLASGERGGPSVPRDRTNSIRSFSYGGCAGGSLRIAFPVAAW